MIAGQKFKFNLGERVFILGQPGICIVSARGIMNFLSGGTLNLYQVNGGHDEYVPEYLLLFEEEIIKRYKGKVQLNDNA